jgi:deazaflavin-dependent oxidoreductase (nitroreductase family)
MLDDMGPLYLASRALVVPPNNGVTVAGSMSDERKKAVRVPPRWFVRAAWYIHRALYRVTGGRKGLWLPKANRWGTMRVTTTGRRSGLERSVILGYVEDGPNLVTMAMNGWGESEPAWWLNFQAHPEARLTSPTLIEVSQGGPRRARNGRASGHDGAR